jgi:hypothetical protein
MFSFVILRNLFVEWVDSILDSVNDCFIYWEDKYIRYQLDFMEEQTKLSEDDFSEGNWSLRIRRINSWE